MLPLAMLLCCYALLPPLCLAFEIPDSVTTNPKTTLCTSQKLRISSNRPEIISSSVQGTHTCRLSSHANEGGVHWCRSGG
ncbi:hypothetical protein FPQ18DRAFT_313158 [Pyronema domesticum]|nr:hypothetical protein FPQ18DRAFT_313158 [Pyronema domesticum]